MGALSQLATDVAQAERLKPLREPVSPEERFLLDAILLPSDRLALLSVDLMDAACENDSATARGEISRKLLAIDAVGELKFPGRWVSLRRGAA